MTLFTRNGDGDLVVNLPSEISPVHISSFAGFGNDVFIASATNVLHKVTFSLNNSGDIRRNSSAVLEQIAGHRPHPIYSDQDGPAPSSKLSSISWPLECWTSLFCR